MTSSVNKPLMTVRFSPQSLCIIRLCYSCSTGVEDAQVEELFSLDDSMFDDLK